MRWAGVTSQQQQHFGGSSIAVAFASGLYSLVTCSLTVVLTCGPDPCPIRPTLQNIYYSNITFYWLVAHRTTSFVFWLVGTEVWQKKETQFLQGKGSRRKSRASVGAGSPMPCSKSIHHRNQSSLLLFPILLLLKKYYSEINRFNIPSD